MLSLSIAGVIAVLVAAQAVYAGDGHGERHGNGHASRALVFVQTNEVSGNRVLVYEVAGEGNLSAAGSYATGGNGGIAAPGTESDRLGSQGSLVFDRRHKLLFAVNAGSNSVSTFSLHDNRLELEGVVPSGGQFPASIAVRGKVVYVLNAGGTGIVQGFRLGRDGLSAIPDSARSLGLTNTSPPDFLMSPGQVGFTPDGRELIVTTKTSGNTIDVFQVEGNGLLSTTPVRNPAATPVPFAFTFTPAGRLAMGEAGMSTVTTYDVRRDGTVSDPKSQADGQTALCWIERVGPYYYVSNTGSNTLSGFRISHDGRPSLVTSTGVVARTEPGPIDLTSPAGTPFLYAQTGVGGTIDAFLVNRDGTLTNVGNVNGLPVGMEGIAST